MNAGGEQGKGECGGDGGDLYAVLGLKKECSATDLRTAYKKLALRWHPDRCSSLGSSKSVDEAKIKFQAIQEAYSVLSDTNKRLLYDVGVYDSDDDANGMGEFLREIASMMSQEKPNEGRSETFEELQELFVEMFQADMDAFCGGGTAAGANRASSRVQHGADVCNRASTSSTTTTFPATTMTAPPFQNSCRAAGGGGLKRDSGDMCSGKAKAVASFETAGPGPGSTFCFGVHEGNGSPSVAARGRTGSGCGKRRGVRNAKASSRNGVPASQAGGETPAE